MDTSEMDDIAVAKANTGTKVFIASNVKFVNAMEDLKMNVNMQEVNGYGSYQR